MIRYTSELEMAAGLDHIKASPKEKGLIELIAVRPRENERVVLEACEISAQGGVHGDNWAAGCWKKLPDGSPHPDVQITLMNSRCIALLARDRSRWALAGDQFYVDMDLSAANLPPGQRLALGTAEIQVTDVAHTGCGAFVERYGKAAMLWVNSPEGKALHLRGIYGRVIRDGRVKVGDLVSKL